MAVAERKRIGETLDRVIAGLLIVALAMTTWQLGGYLGQTMAVAIPVLAIALGLTVLRWIVIEPAGLPLGWWWPLPMLAYVAVHVVYWSPVPDRAWLDATLWWWGAAGFWSGCQVARHRSAQFLFMGGVGVIALGAVGMALWQVWVDSTWLPMGRVQVPQYQGRASGTFGIPNSFAAFLAVVFPSALGLALARSRGSVVKIFAGVVAFASLAGIALSVSRGVWLALAVGLAVWPLALAGRSWTRRFGGMIAVTLGALLLAGAAYVWVPTVKTRFDMFISDAGERTRPIMWRMAWRLWQDEPLAGTGGGSYAALLERYRPGLFWDAPRWAHNDYLNTLSDYGVFGFGLSFGIAVIVVLRVWWRRTRSAEAVSGNRRERRAESRALGMGLLALALATWVDFHLKIPAIVLLAGVGAAIWSRGRDRRSHARQNSGPAMAAAAWKRWSGGAISLVMVVAAIGWVGPRQQAEGRRFIARSTINEASSLTDPAEIRARLQPILIELQAVVETDPRNAQAWSDLSFARSLQVIWRPKERMKIGQEAEVAARQAVSLSAVVPEYWIHLGRALDLQNRWLDAGMSFVEARKLASNNAFVWYCYARHLGLRRGMLDLAEHALATSLRLDPWNPDANALKEVFAKSR